MKLLTIGKFMTIGLIALGLCACGNMSKSQKGALIGGAVGATTVGLATDSYAGAALGGVGGALIGAAVAGDD